MEFRDLKRQYTVLKEEIDSAIAGVIADAAFIHGRQVVELEEKLAGYVGTKHCISCANGTDALQLALMAWGIGKNDVVFVPDFTFFSSGEVVSAVGAIPMFVDVEWESCNVDPISLEKIIKRCISDGMRPKVIVSVDLFGQPANYDEIRRIAQQYNLLILEDGAQGFGGDINGKRACSFGDISTTSFFPAKPLGCYGDGGAIFTDNDNWATLIRSYCVHGKGTSKYDNVRIGMNSRLDTIQAAILTAKFDYFCNFEMMRMQEVANWYSTLLGDVVEIPIIRGGYTSSWAQYTIKLPDLEHRDGLSLKLKNEGIPSAIYYQKAMHEQEAFRNIIYYDEDYSVTLELCKRVLSLPFHPYLRRDEVENVVEIIKNYMN